MRGSNKYADGDPLRDRCVQELVERGPLAVRDIAAAVDAKPEDVREALRRALAAGMAQSTGLARAARWEAIKPGSRKATRPAKPKPKAAKGPDKPAPADPMAQAVALMRTALQTQLEETQKSIAAKLAALEVLAK